MLPSAKKKVWNETLSAHDVYAHLYYIHPLISCCLFYCFNFFFFVDTRHINLSIHLCCIEHIHNMYTKALYFTIFHCTQKKRGEGENLLEYVSSTAHKRIHTMQEVVIPKLFIGWYFTSEPEIWNALKTDEWL